jgi:hypothetical protein
VDRIGQKSDTVHLYLITHEKIEQQIRLRQRIKDRLGAAAEAFGSDEKFFGTDREIKILDDFYKGRVTDDDTTTKPKPTPSARPGWCGPTRKNSSPHHREGPAHAGHGPLHPRPVRSTNTAASPATSPPPPASTPSPPATAYGRSGSSPPSKPCTSSAPTPTPPPHPARRPLRARDELVQGTLKTETIAAGNLKGIRKWAWQRLGGTFFAAKATDALDALHARPLTEHATMRLTQARRNKYSPDDLADLINQLHDEDRLVIGSTDHEPSRSSAR